MSIHTSYLQEITYTNSFFSELNPHLLAYTAHIMGFEIPDMQKPCTYCELGCGSGFSLLTYAAANPHGFFIGVDFNTHHIVEAKKAAKKSNLTNILFIEKSIEDIHHDVPDCDFIVMHGVYSWVHTDIKKSIRSFIDKKLKPQGLSLISYNTYPGWHIYAPLRMMMREYALGITDNLLEDLIPSSKEFGKMLLKQKPSGGRLKITKSGQIAGFQDNSWVYMAKVEPNGWFPGHLG